MTSSSSSSEVVSEVVTGLVLIDDLPNEWSDEMGEFFSSLMVCVDASTSEGGKAMAVVMTKSATVATEIDNLNNRPPYFGMHEGDDIPEKGTPIQWNDFGYGHKNLFCS